MLMVVVCLDRPSLFFRLLYSMSRVCMGPKGGCNGVRGECVVFIISPPVKIICSLAQPNQVQFYNYLMIKNKKSRRTIVAHLINTIPGPQLKSLLL